MKILRIDIKNFRRLKKCKIDLSGSTTLFVGANNSGKTSAMDALAKFMAERKFVFNDITVSNRIILNKLGETWVKDDYIYEESFEKWEEIFPTMDIWIESKDNELQYISNIIPTLDWNGGRVGVRLVYAPKDGMNLYQKYIEVYKNARKIEKESDTELKLWPSDFCDFLSQGNFFYSDFKLKAYVLDPNKCDVEQKSDSDMAVDEGNPLKKLIKVDIISAQRGFSDPIDSKGESSQTSTGLLSTQLRSYYDKHLNPENMPTVEDIASLEALRKAESTFDTTLKEKFRVAINELENMGYPGVNNPKITIESQLSAIETLKHESAVEYILPGNSDYKLPEKYNGLGYQNLVSMAFLLMRFRDDWMKVGKAKEDADNEGIEPIHLVLLEEPEAHLHVQVQQVFIKKSYDILRNHARLGKKEDFITQLVISTHSSNITKESRFENLRYFRRLDCNEDIIVPTSEVVNLSDVFGENKLGSQTDKFVTRYIQTTHCDLFFADAVILVEGAAENMLLPHFIKNKFEELNSSYISVLEINGRHSHRLKPLLEKICIPVLIITDLDVGEASGYHKHACPERNKGLVTTNYAIGKWLIQNDSLDYLLDLPFEQKVKYFETPYKFPICIAYQIPEKIDFKEEKNVEALSSTFEDNLIYKNLKLFSSVPGDEFITEINNLIDSELDIDSFRKKLDSYLRQNSNKKASFALDLIYAIDPVKLEAPTYIAMGLKWLSDTLSAKRGTENG